MKTVVGLLAAVLLLGGVVAIISRGSQFSQAIQGGFGGFSNLVSNVEHAGGIVWLLSYAGVWIILVFMADAGAGELAEVLAGVIFITVLGTQLVNGQLQANMKALGVGA